MAVTFGLPLVIYLLYFLSTKRDYVLLTYANLQDFQLTALLEKLPKQLWATDDAAGWLTVTAAQIFMGWMVLCVVLERLLPGERVTGVAPHSLSYWLSGHLQFWVTLFLLFFGNVTLEWSEHNHVHFASAFSAFPLEVLYDEYLGLITISCLFSFALSLYLYASSFVGDKVLAEHGNTGFSFYDFFIGRELNPRLFNNTFDLKEFCELRPGPKNTE